MQPSDFAKIRATSIRKGANLPAQEVLSRDLLRALATDSCLGQFNGAPARRLSERGGASA